MFLMCWILPLSDAIRCFDKKEDMGGNLELKKHFLPVNKRMCPGSSLE